MANCLQAIGNFLANANAATALALLNHVMHELQQANQWMQQHQAASDACQKYTAFAKMQSTIAAINQMISSGLRDVSNLLNTIANLLDSTAKLFVLLAAIASLVPVVGPAMAASLLSIAEDFDAGAKAVRALALAARVGSLQHEMIAARADMESLYASVAASI